MILGLTGRMASGKDQLANCLMAQGFNHYSLSDEIRAELNKQGLPENRGNLHNIGTQLREKFGPTVLAERALSKLKQPAIISSIRHPAEVQYFKKNYPNFKLIELQTKPEIRFARLKQRGRTGDFKDYQSFLKHEQKESESDELSAPQVNEVIALSDIKIDNNGTKEQLCQKANEIIKQLQRENE